MSVPRGPRSVIEVPGSVLEGPMNVPIVSRSVHKGRRSLPEVPWGLPKGSRVYPRVQRAYPRLPEAYPRDIKVPVINKLVEQPSPIPGCEAPSLEVRLTLGKRNNQPPGCSYKFSFAF